MRWFALLALGSLTACPDKAAPPVAGRSGLRVPLPDGWVAVPVGERLEAGPPGRAAVLLEPRDVALPTVEALVGTVESEKVRVIEKESTTSFVAVRYVFSLDGGAGPTAFLAVKALGGKSLLCSSAPGARGEDLTAALALCRDVSREGAK